MSEERIRELESALASLVKHPGKWLGDTMADCDCQSHERARRILRERAEDAAEDLALAEEGMAIMAPVTDD